MIAIKSGRAENPRGECVGPTCGADYSAPSTAARDEFPKYLTRNVTVRHNTLRAGMGLSIGSETSGGIKDILIESNVGGLCSDNYTNPGVDDPSCSGKACSWLPCGWNAGLLHVKTTLQRGKMIENVLFRNNTVHAAYGCGGLITNYQTGDIAPHGWCVGNATQAKLNESTCTIAGGVWKPPYPATHLKNLSWIDNRCGVCDDDTVCKPAGFGCAPAHWLLCLP
jgi:polygalacturonase